MRVDRRVGARLPRAGTVRECAGLLRCVSSLVVGSERPLLPLLRLVRRSWFLAIDLTRHRGPSAQTGSGPGAVRIVAIGRMGALGPAVGNGILRALTWSATLTMVYAATCRFACVSR